MSQFTNPAPPQVKCIAVNEEAAAEYSAENTPTLDNPAIVNHFWNETIAKNPIFDHEKEFLIVIILNSRLKVKSWNLVSIGALNETVAHPREILRPVIVGAGYGFIMMHNHPGGDPSPSSADSQLTRRLREAADLMQIRFFDHVIVSSHPGIQNKSFSFREAGII